MLMQKRNSHDNCEVISDDAYFVIGVKKILEKIIEKINVCSVQTIKIIDARSGYFPVLAGNDIAIVLCSSKERHYARFISLLAPYHEVVMCAQLDVVIKRLADLLSGRYILESRFQTVKRVLNSNEIDFMRLTLKGFTVRQYSNLRGKAEKTVYGYKMSVAAKLNIEMKYFNHMILKYFIYNDEVFSLN